MQARSTLIDRLRHWVGLGISFLSRFEICEVDSSILNDINFVDTPGILSGEKQRMDRGYSFEQVVSWFAERADRILLLFDGNKLDISDELKRVIEILKGQDDKIRIVLNKADMIDSQQLMRVYGALMWSLGKVIKSPECSSGVHRFILEQTLRIHQ